MVEFREDGHSYTSADGTNWISVSTLVHKFCPHFDAEKQSVKSSKNKKSKWYGMTPEDIRTAWENENKRSVELGSWYHAKMEEQMYQYPEYDGVPVVPPVVKDGVKYGGKQTLKDGVYPEHLVYLPSAGVCGQSDLPILKDGKIRITDYKSNKEIRTQGYFDYNTGTQKMLPPLQHLDHCEFTHYSLQLSLYAYMIQRHNPSYEVGDLYIHHIKFEEEGRDKYDYPIYKRNEYGDPIVKEVIPMKLPYLRAEVVQLIEWAKNNKTASH